MLIKKLNHVSCTTFTEHNIYMKEYNSLKLRLLHPQFYFQIYCLQKEIQQVKSFFCKEMLTVYFSGEKDKTKHFSIYLQPFISDLYRLS